MQMIVTERPRANDEPVFDWKLFVYAYFAMATLVYILMYHGIM